MENQMFCFQCQETAGGRGCTVRGVCGKTPPVAAMQDLLVYVTKGVGVVATKMREAGLDVPEAVDRLVTENLFVTITNANFDEEAIRDRVARTMALRDELCDELCAALGEAVLPDAATWQGSREEYAAKAAAVGVLRTENEDVRSLRELTLYGLKGLAAYVKHANMLGGDSREIDAFIQSALARLLDDSLDGAALTALALETGKFGVDGMALLDASNTGAYGDPEITTVDLGVRKNPGILISGHDLRDLEMLLEQTAGTGVDVYTHGEMLPAHYYPAFKKYPHFAGNYGNAWWQQKEEFAAFHGPILMTTNCVVPPADSYRDRLYTTGAVGVAGCPHIAGDRKHKDFSALIAQAKQCPPPAELEQGTIVGGFAHAQVFALADKVVEAVKSGAIRKFVVMAGCDGRMKSRAYYREFAEKLPKDTVILTAGCAKYKYIKLPLG
ncbi:MAG: hydroxylamine reductase, partial [Schwartzia sp. (in: firmicutes)]